MIGLASQVPDWLAVLSVIVGLITALGALVGGIAYGSVVRRKAVQEATQKAAEQWESNYRALKETVDRQTAELAKANLRIDSLLEDRDRLTGLNQHLQSQIAERDNRLTQLETKLDMWERGYVPSRRRPLRGTANDLVGDGGN